MKTLTIILISCILLSNSFGATELSRITKAINETTFRISQLDSLNSVEADKHMMESLKKEIELIKDAGHTNAEILNFIKSEIKSPEIARELDIIVLNSDLNNLNENDILNLIVERLRRSKVTGANYIGSSITYTAIGILVFVTLLLIISSGDTCEDQGGVLAPDCSVYVETPWGPECRYTCQFL